MTYSRAISFTLFCLLWIPSVIAQDSLTQTPPAPTPQPAVRPVPFATLSDNGIISERLFGALVQGQVGVMRITGADIQEARVLFRNHEYPFYDSGVDGWYALVVADIDAQPRDYVMSVVVQQSNGTLTTLSDSVTITAAGFIRQIFELPPNLAFLTEPEVERNEYARIDALTADITPQRYWTADSWTLPMSSGYSARFGQYRILNDVVQTRHTGWDQSAPVGTPVSTIMDGVVIYADTLDIRGNYVLIDHGWGVYSGYAHFSQFNVQAGQTVQQGAIIGLSGNTGRSNGPHLHWEILVNGEWIDGVAFLEMWLPS